MKRFLLLTAVLVVPEAALGQEYKPDFNCAADLSKDSIATMLCQNSEAAKHELIFDQTYYALRQIVGKEGWKALKQEAIADDDVFKACVGPETADGALPRADPYCYISTMDALTQKYRRRLSGSALEEASRPIDQHIALQQKFIDLGYLLQAALQMAFMGKLREKPFPHGRGSRTGPRQMDLFPMQMLPFSAHRLLRISLTVLLQSRSTPCSPNRTNSRLRQKT